MAASDDNASNQHCPARTQPFVCKPTADQRRPINRRSVRPHDQTCVGTLKRKAALLKCGDHVKKENRFQAVKTKSFPHLCEEQGCQTTRMPGDPACIAR